MCLSIGNKDVLAFIGVAGHEVSGGGLEDNIAAIAAEVGIVTAAIAGFAAASFAGAFQRQRLPVENENVFLQVVILAGEIGSGGGERHETGITADTHWTAVVVAQAAIRRAAYRLQGRRRQRACHNRPN